MQTMLRNDFLLFDGLQSFTYTDVSTAGSTTQTVDNARITFPVTKAFGEPAVKGYQIDSVSLTFPDNEITVTPTIGDYVSVESTTYEVTNVEKVTAYTRWRLQAERAYVDDAWDLTATVQRATLGVDIAGSVTETWANIGSYSVIVWDEPDVADMINRLGVKADKQTTTFFFAQTVPVLSMDRIVYENRPYRITAIQDEGLVARLLKVRCELYG